MRLARTTQGKTEAARPPFSFRYPLSALPQPTRGMGEQGVDQARLRGEVGAQRLRGPRSSRATSRRFFKQAPSLGVDRVSLRFALD